MMQVSDICHALGRAKIASRLRVGTPAVSNAATAGVFPAHWFDIIEVMCVERGIECPRCLFSFKRVDDAADISPSAA